MDLTQYKVIKFIWRNETLHLILLQIYIIFEDYWLNNSSLAYPKI